MRRRRRRRAHAAPPSPAYYSHAKAVAALDDGPPTPWSELKAVNPGRPQAQTTPRPQGVAVPWSGSDKSPAAAATGLSPEGPKDAENLQPWQPNAGTPPERPTIAVPTTPTAAFGSLHGPTAAASLTPGKAALKPRTPGRAMTPKAGVLSEHVGLLSKLFSEYARGAAGGGGTAFADGLGSSATNDSRAVDWAGFQSFADDFGVSPNLVSPEQLLAVFTGAANAAADGEKSRARSRLLPYAAFTLSLRALAAAAFPDLAEAAAAAESEKGGSGAAARKLIAHVGKAFRKRKAKAEHKPAAASPRFAVLSGKAAAAASPRRRSASTASTASAPPELGMKSAAFIRKDSLLTIPLSQPQNGRSARRSGHRCPLRRPHRSLQTP